jgi:[ribosomal protein S18]-alanine N-acetyltransferase
MLWRGPDSLAQMAIEIRALGPGDDGAVVGAQHLFDGPADPEATAEFLADERHVLLVAYDGDAAIGFVSGVFVTHPDKGTEMFLYELGVTQQRRREGTGRTLVQALATVARDRSCSGMWVGVDADNEAALATYESAGAHAVDPVVIREWTF